MIDKQESLTNEDTRNFSQKWLDNIHDILMRIETYQRLMVNGCETLIDFIENKDIDLVLVQYKNYRLLISEIEILLENTRFFIDRTKLLGILVSIKKIKKYEKDLGGFLFKSSDYVNHTSWNELKPEFENVIPKLCELRAILIEALMKFLDPTIKSSGGDGL